MTVATVFRPQFDWRGDPIAGSDKIPVGTVDILPGGSAPQRVDGREETASTEGMIGIWTYQDSGVDVRAGDRVEFDGDRYTVVGKPLWKHEHSFSGTDTLNDVYWIKVEAKI